MLNMVMFVVDLQAKDTESIENFRLRHRTGYWTYQISWRNSWSEWTHGLIQHQLYDINFGLDCLLCCSTKR
jgi:hypothetical protein